MSRRNTWGFAISKQCIVNLFPLVSFFILHFEIYNRNDAHHCHGATFQSRFLHGKRIAKNVDQYCRDVFFVTSTKFKILLYMAELLRPLSFYLNSNENPFTDGSSPCFRYPCLFLFQYVSICTTTMKLYLI